MPDRVADGTSSLRGNDLPWRRDRSAAPCTPVLEPRTEPSTGLGITAKVRCLGSANSYRVPDTAILIEHQIVHIMRAIFRQAQIPGHC